MHWLIYNIDKKEMGKHRRQTKDLTFVIISFEMVTYERFCLSYNNFNQDFRISKKKISSINKRAKWP